MRRYAAANRLNRLGTLTYEGEGCHDSAELRKHMSRFFRNLRKLLGGKPLPYVWVPEWHKTDHGLHVHFALGRYVRRSIINEAWGRGFVHIKLLGDLPVGSTTLHEARLAARYLSKYVGKDFGTEHERGRHRYDVAEDFQPREVVVRAIKLDQAIAHASEIMGRRPESVSLSQDWPNWTGPTAVGVRSVSYTHLTLPTIYSV